MDSYSYDPEQRRAYLDALEGILLPILTVLRQPQLKVDKTESGCTAGLFLKDGALIMASSGRTPREAGAELGLEILRALLTSKGADQYFFEKPIKEANSISDFWHRAGIRGDTDLFNSHSEGHNALDSLFSAVALGFMDNLGGTGVGLKKSGDEDTPPGGPFTYEALLVNKYNESIYAANADTPEECGLELAQHIFNRFLTKALMPGETKEKSLVLRMLESVGNEAGITDEIPEWLREAANAVPDKYFYERSTLAASLADSFIYALTNGKYRFSDIRHYVEDEDDTEDDPGEPAFATIDVFDSDKEESIVAGFSVDLDEASYVLAKKLLCHLKKPTKKQKKFRPIWYRIAWKFLQQLTDEEIALLRSEKVCKKLKKEERTEKEYPEYFSGDDPIDAQ